ncbi:MAG: flagellar hook-basal body protein [Verrucomicrobiota bacterium]|nr:flagellar hook-basal body protein [Verrucomicrobiota bacterium]
MNVSLYQAASALNANQRWQEVISQNMAASSIPGFKKQELSFSAVEAGMIPKSSAAGSVGGAQHWTLPEAKASTSFAAGPLKYTGLKTDVAVEGTGFFEVQLPNGSKAYTRDGEFSQNAQGQLITKQGYLVLGEGGPIQLDRNNPGPLVIGTDGQVSQGQEVKGTLRVVEFGKPELLTSIPGGYFLASDPNLTENSDPTSVVRQGYVEGANTNAVAEMANLITVMRSSEANQRIVQMEDERMGKAISELGSPN